MHTYARHTMEVMGTRGAAASLRRRSVRGGGCWTHIAGQQAVCPVTRVLSSDLEAPWSRPETHQVNDALMRDYLDHAEE